MTFPKALLFTIFIPLFSWDAGDAVGCDSADYAVSNHGCVPCQGAILFSRDQASCNECQRLCDIDINSCVAFVYNDTSFRCTGFGSFEESNIFGLSGTCFVKNGVSNRPCPAIPPATTVTTTSPTVTTETLPTFFKDGCDQSPDYFRNHTYCNCADFNITNEYECDEAGGTFLGQASSFDPIGSRWCKFQFETDKNPNKEPRGTTKWCNVPFNKQASSWTCEPFKKLVNPNTRYDWCPVSTINDTISTCREFCQAYTPLKKGTVYSKLGESWCRCSEPSTPFFWDACPSTPATRCRYQVYCDLSECSQNCQDYKIYNKKDCESAQGVWTDELPKYGVHATCANVIAPKGLYCKLPFFYAKIQNRSTRGCVEDQDSVGSCPEVNNEGYSCDRYCKEGWHKVGRARFGTPSVCTCSGVQVGAPKACGITYRCQMSSTSSTSKTTTGTVTTETTKSSTSLTYFTSTISTSSVSSRTTKISGFCFPLANPQHGFVAQECSAAFTQNIPHGQACVTGCNPTFEHFSGDVIRTCSKDGVFSGSPLVCACPSGLSYNDATGKCETSTRSSTTSTTTSTCPYGYVYDDVESGCIRTSEAATSTNGSSDTGDNAERGTGGEENKSPVVVIVVVVVVVLLLIVVAFGIIRYRNSSEMKGTIMDELSRKTNPHMVPNPMYETQGPKSKEGPQDVYSGYSATTNNNNMNEYHSIVTDGGGSYESSEGDRNNSQVYSGYEQRDPKYGDLNNGHASYGQINQNNPVNIVEGGGSHVYSVADELNNTVLITEGAGSYDEGGQPSNYSGYVVVGHNKAHTGQNNSNTSEDYESIEPNKQEVTVAATESVYVAKDSTQWAIPLSGKRSN
eukprot:m.297663 g.297663  ORF g.297663 m.297663 type:complete len:852 (-) comp16403_c4_seq1:138-2693(-)